MNCEKNASDMQDLEHTILHTLSIATAMQSQALNFFKTYALRSTHSHMSDGVRVPKFWQGTWTLVPL